MLQWSKNVEDALRRGTGHLLAFNEPDVCQDQACMTPEAAAAAYKTFLQPYAHRASLGSPGVTSQDGIGLPWLKEFMEKCEGCAIDFVAVH